MKLSGTEAFMRRSNSLQRESGFTRIVIIHVAKQRGDLIIALVFHATDVAEQRAREESEKLRQQEREQIAENRRRDLVCVYLIILCNSMVKL
ncbi:hypothetical protein CK203_031087 [Vitis vinifera]|uniref:Uncharacterized protein n=1 Tax=Vitis vinifera TaxID=29760 RepID=A0A438J0E7_VITVI|nr:hypothetical protein CK203_031087 [Vitis vinifera]